MGVGQAGLAAGTWRRAGSHLSVNHTTRNACCWFRFPGKSSSARSDTSVMRAVLANDHAIRVDVIFGVGFAVRNGPSTRGPSDPAMLKRAANVSAKGGLHRKPGESGNLVCAKATS